jgi:hypothetical protein
MKTRFYISIGVLFVVAISAFSFSLPKKRKFLDHFTEYKMDTLSVNTPLYEEIYENTNTPVSIKGVCIDTIHNHVYGLEGADDIREFTPIGNETGPVAYHKIKLDLGYYLLIIRAGGEYWNSRLHACLYNAGNKKIMNTLPVADALGDAGSYYERSSQLKKEDKQWTIYSHEIYYEPLDVDWESLDTFEVKEIDIVTIIEPKDEHFFFTEKSKKENTYIRK